MAPMRPHPRFLYRLCLGSWQLYLEFSRASECLILVGNFGGWACAWKQKLSSAKHIDANGDEQSVGDPKPRFKECNRLIGNLYKKYGKVVSHKELDDAIRGKRVPKKNGFGTLVGPKRKR